MEVDIERKTNFSNFCFKTKKVIDDEIDIFTNDKDQMISQEFNENEHYEQDDYKSISHLMKEKSVTNQKSELMSQYSKHDFDIGKLG